MPMDWDFDYVNTPSLTDRVGFYKYAQSTKEPYDNISHLWSDYLDGIPIAKDPNATNNRIVFPSNIKIDATTYIDSVSKYEPYAFTQASLGDLTSGQVRNYNYSPHCFQIKGRFRDLFGINGTNTQIDKPMITYGALKKNIEPYNELTSITYFDVAQTKTGNTIEVRGGDTFITPMVVELANRGAG
jgi:hypothetical protein